MKRQSTVTKPASRKRKGRRLEVWFARKLAEILNLTYGQDGDIQPKGSRPGPDICLPPALRHLFPYSVECKNQERWQLRQFIQQAMEHCLPDTSWLLVLKQNHQKPLVLMEAETFFVLIQKSISD